MPEGPEVRITVDQLNQLVSNTSLQAININSGRYSKKNPPLQNKAPFYKTGFMGINPDHKGYCTPMTKATCTPPRKALAKRLKPGGDLYKGKK